MGSSDLTRYRFTLRAVGQGGGGLASAVAEGTTWGPVTVRFTAPEYRFGEADGGAAARVRVTAPAGATAPPPDAVAVAVATSETGTGLGYAEVPEDVAAVSRTLGDVQI